jgi:transcriptional regulator with XRE-family HTH domain
MKISSALSQKILRICKEKNISINKLASMCYLTQSTLESLITEKSRNPKLLTVVRICEGLNISLKDFFDDELFDNIEREE